ncbi:MAG TPA: YgeY family selenium metabolism-linked hydrolase [Anaerolineae bacterium]|nr:YgeY family selenium metabolism-linked hydrolase [Anaerolineae bacterium]
MRLAQTEYEQVVALTRELVRAKSLAGQEREAALICERWMRQLGYDEVWVDRYGSVVGQRHGVGPGKAVHFDGHLDVVPATSPEEWQHDPFGGELSDGKIWGRGSSDMKGPVAAMMCAGAFVPRDQFRGTITVSASVGEEELEGPALAAILQEHPADVVIIGESSELKIGIGQKGRAGIQIETHGVPAHSSRPEEGVNAVYKMIEAVNRLRALPPPIDPVLTPGISELVEIVSAPYPGTSIVPDGCRARIDRRLVRGETRESVLAWFQDALRAIDGAEVRYLQVTLPCYTGATIVMDDFHPAWVTPRESDLVKRAERALASVNLPVDYFTARYCANGSASAGEMNIPTLIFGPSTPALAHVVDEYIEIEQLVHGTEAYMALAVEVLRERREFA